MEIIIDILEVILSLFTSDGKRKKERKTSEIVEVKSTTVQLEVSTMSSQAFAKSVVMSSAILDPPQLPDPKHVEVKETMVEDIAENENDSEGIDPRKAMKWSLIFSEPRAKQPYCLPTYPRKYG